MRRLVTLLALLVSLLAPQLARATCVNGGCIAAGPMLASVSSTQSVLLNTLLGTLTGSSLTVTALDWNSIATGDVSLVKTINALQAQLGLSSTTTALNTPITLGQLSAAASTAASSEGLTNLSVGLGDLGAQLNVPGTITLGSLLQSDGIVGTTRINALSLISGAIELFNTQNVATTTSPITVSGLSLGLAGTIGQVSVLAQVVEPPVYVCGPAGTSFHSSAIRVKLNMQLVSLLPSTSGINILGLTISNLVVGQLTIYAEIGLANGTITAVNALANTLSAQVTPGVAALYIGQMNDTAFFNRTHVINPATDLSPGTIGSVLLNGTTVGLLAKAAAVGTAPSATTLTFSGTGIQTRTATTGALFESTLLSSLVGNLSITLSPDLLGGTIDGLLLPVLTTLVDTVLSPVLTVLDTSLIDPLLALVGVQVGTVSVSSGGTYLTCALSGCVFADPNHNARQDSGEAGTGTTLYAKAILPAAPTVAAAVVTVDPTTGNFSFPDLNPATYTIVIGTTNSTSAVTPAGPTGWVPTTGATLSRLATVVAADLTGQSFGLFHGSTVAGSVFKDNGSGGGTANNGVKDGAEPALAGIALRVTDPVGATTWDSTTSDPTGAWQMWVPSTAGAVAMKVSQVLDPSTLPVSGQAGTTGGAFALATGAVNFTNVIGTVYSGLAFGDVPINRLDTDGQQSVGAGTTAIYAHVYHPGTAGQLAFSVAAASTAPTGWSATVWLDANCNGQLDAGELPITAPVAVAADATLCVVVKVFVPETAANETRVAYVLNASLAYANTTLVTALTRTDLTIVGAADGLRLVKTVDKATAQSGDTITYTLTYLNQGASAVANVVMRDTTPAWTVLAAASCGPLPTGITGCAVTAQPAAGSAGSVEWTLTGSLPSGGTGTVILQVRVQ